MLPGRHLWLISNEEVVQVTRDEPGGGWLLGDDVDDVLAIPVAGFT
jgi:hypothetical protein